MFGEQKHMMIGVALAALVLLVIVKKKGAAAAVGQGLGEAAANAAGGLVAGVSEGLGDQIGVPRTDATLCEQAKANGSTWDVSKYCPASDFIDYVNPFN